ncbi:MAG: hypothetical protein KDC44_02585, partial [Phaeodactylibacter sp.]|nr:hypothetical protein [Phaeodactylibacter sp.]
DNDAEGIAFLDSFILVSDTTPEPLTLFFFQPEPRLRLIEEDQPQHGLVKLSFNREPFDADIRYDDFGQYFYRETEKDTIRLWFDWSAEESFNLYVTADTLIDTVLVKGGDRQAFLSSAPLRLTNGLPGGRSQTLNPFKRLELRFNRPIAEFDTSRVQLLKDSTLNPVPFSIQKDSANPKLLYLTQNWTELLNYKLVLLPGGITDVYGIENDTLRQNYRIDEKKNYGNIALTLEQLDSTQQYVIRFMKGDKLIQSFKHQNSRIFTASFKHLLPGDYQLDIIEDRDGNGRWDPGAYENYRPSENRYTKKLEPLRANWDLEATLSLEQKGE